MKSGWRITAAALAVTALMSACGGGSGQDEGESTKASRVVVVGDSLSDSGTFGYKFTVQGQDEQGDAFKVWSELVALRYNNSKLCAHYSTSDEDTMAGYTEDEKCSNYAVGGAQINARDANAQPATLPLSILQQLKHAGEQGYAARDLLLVDGGANDVSSLIVAFLTGSVLQDFSQFLALVGTLLDADTVATLSAQGEQGRAELGGLYMQAVARQLQQGLQSDALAKGVERVVVLNIPDVTKTPRLAMILQIISAVVTPEALSDLTQMIDGWVKAYNGTLSQGLQNEPRVLVSDFYSNLSEQVSNPAKFGYTNVSNAACAELAGVADGQLNLCTSTLLENTIPAGQSSKDWWKSYMFSNTFHPTPLGYQNMSQFVWNDMEKKGWKP